MEIISLELRKLGLKEKEVKVYLAGLRLGPAPLQDIAREADISRPTAYEMVKHLEAKGLFTEASQAKKRYFASQPPENVLGILRLQKKEVEEREREFIRIIAALDSYGKSGTGIKTFHGAEGLRMLKERISFSSVPELFVISSHKENVRELADKIKKRLGKVEVKQLLAKELGGALFLFDQAAFISNQKQGGWLIDHPVLLRIFKSLANLLERRC